jgi:hypothetical protein
MHFVMLDLCWDLDACVSLHMAAYVVVWGRHAIFDMAGQGSGQVCGLSVTTLARAFHVVAFSRIVKDP